MINSAASVIAQTTVVNRKCCGSKCKGNMQGEADVHERKEDQGVGSKGEGSTKTNFRGRGPGSGECKEDEFREG